MIKHRGGGPPEDTNNMPRDTGTVFTIDRVGTYISKNLMATFSPGVSSDGYRIFLPDRYLHIHTFCFENT